MPILNTLPTSLSVNVGVKKEILIYLAIPTPLIINDQINIRTSSGTEGFLLLTINNFGSIGYNGLSYTGVYSNQNLVSMLFNPLDEIIPVGTVFNIYGISVTPLVNSGSRSLYL